MSLPVSASAKSYPLRSCGTVAAVTEGVKAREKITARGYSCAFARRLVGRSNVGRVPKGWTCLGSGEGVICVKGSFERYKHVVSHLSARYRYVRGSLVI